MGEIEEVTEVGGEGVREVMPIGYLEDILDSEGSVGRVVSSRSSSVETVKRNIWVANEQSHPTEEHKQGI